MILVYALFGVSQMVAAKNTPYTQEEIDLSRVPEVKFHDHRLRDIYKIMAKQYRHLYDHAAADGYILPNEMRDLQFHRRFMSRLHIIDQQYHKLNQLYKDYAARDKKRLLKPEDKKILAEIRQKQSEYESMIRRFACRYLPNYAKKHKKHCPKKR
jgi:uncharacterized membrane-anchored protein YhcB (DUF1043 family)